MKQQMLSDSNTNINSMINRRVSLFYRYPLKAFHHMVCPCTLYGVCVVCPGTSELVGQQQTNKCEEILPSTRFSCFPTIKVAACAPGYMSTPYLEHPSRLLAVKIFKISLISFVYGILHKPN